MGSEDAAADNAKVTGRILLDVNDVQVALADGPEVRRIMWRFQLLPVLLLAFVVVAQLGDRPVKWTDFVPAVVLFILLTIGLKFLFARNARRILEGKSERERDLSFEFDESGYAIMSPAGSSRAEWSTLHHYHEVKSAFLLYSNPSVHQLVPKRAFDEPSIERLRALLATHVKPRPRSGTGLGPLVLWVVLVLVFVAGYFLFVPGTPRN